MAKTSNCHPKELPPLLLLVILTPPQPASLHHLCTSITAPAPLHQHLCISTSELLCTTEHLHHLVAPPLHLFTTVSVHLASLHLCLHIYTSMLCATSNLCTCTTSSAPTLHSSAPFCTSAPLCLLYTSCTITSCTITSADHQHLLSTSTPQHL